MAVTDKQERKVVSFESIKEALLIQQEEERRAKYSFTKAATKLQNLKDILKKYEDTFKKTSRYDNTMNDIRNQILVLEEIFNSDLEVTRWENSYKLDLEEYENTLIELYEQ